MSVLLGGGGILLGQEDRGGGASLPGGIWRPEISNVYVNDGGTGLVSRAISIQSAHYVDGGGSDSFEIFYKFDPLNNINITSYSFDISLPPQIAVNGFYGYNQVFINETNADGDSVAGYTGGGGISISDEESPVAPYTFALVQCTMASGTPANRYPNYGFIRGVLIE